MKITEHFKRYLFEFESNLFDSLNNIDTKGIINTVNLDVDEQSKINSNAFMSVWIRNIRKLISYVSKNDLNQLNFIDIGCGKGRACFYASKTGLFQSIIGIDFSEKLIHYSVENKQKFFNSNKKIKQEIHFLKGDAIHYKLANKKNFIFLFNPFNEIILSFFIDNNIEIFKNNTNYVAYANDIHRNVLENKGFKLVFRDSKRAISLWKM
jgi:SAM-dependent methyltransferase